MQQKIQLAFYGDDFTGSTDALEFICRAGASAVLFIEPPTVQQVQSFGVLNVIGVAGQTRALANTEMKATLQDAFEKLKAIGARHIHYKVCSTFDSSPQTGSIGLVMDLAAAVFKTPRIPILGGTPLLGRYCAFGNLFARMGIGTDGEIYRLDRHPSMRAHPVTPALESDLRLHLGAQTSKKIELIDIVDQQQPIQQWSLSAQGGAVLIDATEEAQLLKIGAWLDAQADRCDTGFFSIGSSAIEMALGAFWQQQDILRPKTSWLAPGSQGPLLVVSGSCSPVTAAQIAWARDHGFKEWVLDAAGVCNGGAAPEWIAEVLRSLKDGQSVIIHTGVQQGPQLSSEKLGSALGRIARTAVMEAGIRRVVVAGGDTSSYAARAMEISAVEMIAPLVAGAPLCRAHSSNLSIDGLEVNFKGGQVGGADYFGLLQKGAVL